MCCFSYDYTENYLNKCCIFYIYYHATFRSKKCIVTNGSSVAVGGCEELNFQLQ